MQILEYPVTDNSPTKNSLLDQLLDIERSIGFASNATLREKLQNAQHTLLQIQKETAENYRKEAIHRGSESNVSEFTPR